MFSKVVAAAALAIVSAADVPVFSSNDDYDEINLNIRMLSGNTTASSGSASGSAVVHDIRGNVGGDYALPNDVTAVVISTLTGTGVGFQIAQSVAQGLENTFSGASVTVTEQTGTSARRLEENDNKRKLTTTWSITSDYRAVFATAAAAAAGATLSQQDDFATNVATNVGTALATNSGGAITVTGITASAAAPPAGPAGTPAAPSPSPSSNAVRTALSACTLLTAAIMHMMM